MNLKDNIDKLDEVVSAIPGVSSNASVMRTALTIAGLIGLGVLTHLKFIESIVESNNNKNNNGNNKPTEIVNGKEYEVISFLDLDKFGN